MDVPNSNMAIEITGAPPRFPLITGFVAPNHGTWTCVYMKLSAGRWEWASKVVHGAYQEVRSSWATSLLTPFGVVTEGVVSGWPHLTPPREWEICKEGISGDWYVLQQRTNDRGFTVPFVEVVMAHHVDEVRARWPRAIFWPMK